MVTRSPKTLVDLDLGFSFPLFFISSKNFFIGACSTAAPEKDPAIDRYAFYRQVSTQIHFKEKKGFEK